MEKTPPCVDTLINNAPGRVVIGTLDPNPVVNGKGVKLLKSKGIKVEVGILADECRQLNEYFLNLLQRGCLT